MDVFVRDKILQGFQKLSEGEETISAGEHKRWKRSRLKLKSVLISHGLCFFPKKYVRFTCIYLHFYLSKCLLVHGYAVTNLWEAGELLVKRNRVCCFPGVRVDCHDKKKTKTKIVFCFFAVFSYERKQKFASFSCFQETKGVISSAGYKGWFCS